MRLRHAVSVLLVCLIRPDGVLADVHLPDSFDDPAKFGLMTPDAKSELDACVARADESAGDDQERRVMVGVFIGSQGRPVSLAVLESSGLEPLDKLILRCVARARYTPAEPGKAPIQWIFKSTLKPNHARPALNARAASEGSSQYPTA